MFEKYGRTPALRSTLLLAVALTAVGLTSTSPVASAETKRPASAPAEDTPAETADPWAPFHHLIGHWEATITGILGEGTGKRSYKLILDDKYAFVIAMRLWCWLIQPVARLLMLIH